VPVLQQMKEHKGVVEERKARVLRKDVEGLAGDQVDVSMVRDLADLTSWAARGSFSLWDSLRLVSRSEIP